MTRTMRPLESPPAVPLAAAALFGRMLKALGIGLVATVAGSAAGGAWFALMAIALDGAAGTLAAPGIVMWGLVFGPMWAIPITLGVLPLLRVLWPRRWLALRGRGLLCAGPLAAGLHMVRLVQGDHEFGVMSWVMLGAATAGGLAAGLVFRAFEPKQSIQRPASS